MLGFRLGCACEASFVASVSWLMTPCCVLLQLHLWMRLAGASLANGSPHLIADPWQRFLVGPWMEHLLVWFFHELSLRIHPPAISHLTQLMPASSEGRDICLMLPSSLFLCQEQLQVKK